MKPLLMLLALTLGPMAPAFHATETEAAPEIPTETLVHTNWGPWTAIARYPGLRARVQRSYQFDDGSYKWFVQYENRYSETVHLSTTLTRTDERPDSTTDRIHIQRGDTGGTWIKVGSSTNVQIWTDKVRLGKDSGPYLDPQR